MDDPYYMFFKIGHPYGDIFLQFLSNVDFCLAVTPKYPKRFYKKKTLKTENIDFSWRKYIVNDPISVIWLYIDTLQLFGKFQGQSLSISVFIPIKYL